MTTQPKQPQCTCPAGSDSRIALIDQQCPLHGWTSELPVDQRGLALGLEQSQRRKAREKLRLLIGVAAALQVDGVDRFGA